MAAEFGRGYVIIRFVLEGCTLNPTCDITAKLLFDLGLRRYPPLATLLNIAAGPDPQTRNAALKYFLDNISTKYGDYNPSLFVNLAFVPAVKTDGTKFLAKPHEVCA